ncbi:MAG TPA: arginase family protein [Croceibacterium sp.]
MSGVPHTRPAVWPAVREGRFARSIQTGSPSGARLALLGLPDDTGVLLNRGRPGAKQGPAGFRQVLAGFGTTWDGVDDASLTLPIYDAGDVEPAPGDDERALCETHGRIEAAVSELRRSGLVVVGIGGGHDLTFPSVAAVGAAHGAPLGGINLDAHLDVRARVGSGMPFRRLIERGVLDPRRFVELGLGRFANDQADLDWLRERGGQLVFAREIQRGGLDLDREFDRAFAAGPGFVSIDLDGLDQSVAPGVSAPNPCGLGVSHALELCERAGQDARVLHFDLMELNPAYDREQHTARVAALLFLHFVAGFRRRAV